MNKNKNKKTEQKESGFTLIEILVVIGLIALLAAVVIIAINPARQFAQGRNTQRVSNVNAILNAIGQRMADNKGVFDGTFTAGGVTYTCSVDITYSGTGSATAGDLGCLVPTYVSSVLNDPQSAAAGGYKLTTDAASRVIVSAPSAELGQTISITR